MRSIILGVLLLIPFAAFGNACEIMSGKVQLENGKPALECPANEGENICWIDDCSTPMTIQSEQAEICAHNALKQWACNPYRKENGPWQIAAVTLAKAYVDEFYAALKSLRSPETNLAYAGKRLKEGEPLPGFPYSAILLPADMLVLDLEGAGQANASNFTLFDLGRNEQVFAATVSGPVISLPASLFNPQARYRWTLDVAGVRHSGTFSVAAIPDQAEVEQEFANALPDDGLTGSARHLLRAVVARDYGYTFDYQQSLYRARQGLLSAQDEEAP